MIRQGGAAGIPGQTRLLLWIGFGGLLLLMLVLGSSAVSFLYQVQIHQEQLRQDYVSRDRTLEQLRSAIYLSGSAVRDFLLDRAVPPSSLHATQYKEMLDRIDASLRECATQMPHGQAALHEVRAVLDEYLAMTSRVFTWTPEERAARSYEFTQNELLPRRIQVLTVTDRLRQLSERQLESSRQAISAMLSSFLLRLVVLSILALALGAVLAGLTLRRILRLETAAGLQLKEAKRTGEELARLSADLVAAQETERRKISRELHDEVGQTLYATVLSLGNLRSSLAANRVDDGLRELQLVNELTERTASVVRNMALLLRPAILDDLGLLPALKWLAREATRTQSIPVEVTAEEVPQDLPEDQITCVYRIVQESIHNAERHSHARSIRVDLKNSPGGLTVRVTDDGRGFQPETESGLGVLGMRERASRLGGSVAIESAPGRGSSLVLQLPPAGHGMSPLRTA
jgi:signal transduction histidine kinase